LTARDWHEPENHFDFFARREEAEDGDFEIIARNPATSE
jgi:hypothetical protein